jgi:hypothetical protein
MSVGKYRRYDSIIGNSGGSTAIAFRPNCDENRILHQHCVDEIKRRTHQLVRPKTTVASPYCPTTLPRHQGLTPQRCHRLVRLADSRGRKRPCSSRTYRCRCGRCRCCWLGDRGSCRLCSWLLGNCLFSCWLLGCCLFSCWLLGCCLFSCRLLGCCLFSCRLLGYCLFSCRLLGCCLFGCRLFGNRFLCCWFSFLLCCHFNSPSVLKVNKHNTYDYYTYTSSPYSTASKG